MGMSARGGAGGGLGRLAALGGWSPVLLVVVVCLPTCQLSGLLGSWRVDGVLQGAGRLAALGGGLPCWWVLSAAGGFWFTPG